MTPKHFSQEALTSAVAANMLPHIAPTADTVPSHGVVFAVSEDSPIKPPRPKSETCPRCRHVVDRLVPALDGSGESICLDCYSKARETRALTAHRPVEKIEYPPYVPDCGVCGEPTKGGMTYLPISADAKRWHCAGCAAVHNALATFAAEWAAYERKHIYIASPLAFGALQRLTDAILNRAAPDKPKPPKLELVTPAWELAPSVLDLSTVVNRLDFALVPTSELSDIERAQMERERRRAVVESMAVAA